MICPSCSAEHETSTIEVTGWSVTCLGYSPFYDENGKYHAQRLEFVVAYHLWNRSPADEMESDLDRVRNGSKWAPPDFACAAFLADYLRQL